MRAMIAYIDWLSEDQPIELIGTGSPAFTPPGRAADVEAGELVYAVSCQSCHGENGQGYRRNGAVVIPPLWGNDSYNDGAGMARVLTAAAFIRANMPLGTPWNRPALDEGEAFDVAAYINSFARPAKVGKEQDYPDLLQKPIDAPYPPYADNFSVQQHRIGPYGPIEAARRKLAEQHARVPNPYAR